MRKVTSSLIGKEYYLATEETPDFEKDGLPIFTPSDVAALKELKPEKDLLLKIWFLKSMKKCTIAECVQEINAPLPKEHHTEQYQKPRKNEMAIQYSEKIISDLRGKIPKEENA